MYVNPVLCGVLGTLLVEAVLLITYALWAYSHDGDDGEDE